MSHLTSEEAHSRLGHGEGIDQNTICNWFPDLNVRKRFCQFVIDQDDAARLAEPRTAREELVTVIDSANLLTWSCLYTILPALNREIRPWVPASRCARGFLYRLNPTSWGLGTEEVWDRTLHIEQHILAVKN